VTTIAMRETLRRGPARAIDRRSPPRDNVPEAAGYSARMPIRPLVVMVVVLASGTPAQSPAATQPSPTPATTPEPPTPLQRATNDAAAACRGLADATFAYSGSCRVTGELTKRAAADELKFTGAQRDGLEFFAVGEHRTLLHGERRLESARGDAWTRPQGDGPDCPFAPSLLARHFATGTVDAFLPTDFEGRPAVRVHVTWTRDAAVALLHDLHHPSSHVNGVLEALTNRVERTVQNADTTLEASLRFDPAAKRVYAATLRFAFCPNRGNPEAAAPAAFDADGLRSLGETPAFLCLWHVTIDVPGVPPLPELTPEMQKALAWPREAPAPAAPEPKPPVR